MGVVHPLVIRVLCLAAGVGAIAVEFLQGIPELWPGTHAVGEVIRNLGYAFATGYIFYYFLEERPQQRRRRDAYANSERVLTRLVRTGPGLLESLLTNAELQIERDAMTPGEAWTVIADLPGRSDTHPIVLSPFNTLYRYCERIEDDVRSLGFLEAYLDDPVRKALQRLAALRGRFEGDIWVKSIILATQEPLGKQPETLKAYQPMFIGVASACRRLADAVVESTNGDLQERFRRLQSLPLIDRNNIHSRQPRKTIEVREASPPPFIGEWPWNILGD